MKIYRKIVFDYDFNVIEEDSYEYDGDIAKCDGGGSGADNDADASAQGMVDAEANSQTSFGNTGHSSQDPSGMAGMFGISFDSSGMPNYGSASGEGFSPSEAQAVAKAADTAVKNGTFSWSSFLSEIGKGAVLGFSSAGLKGVPAGAIVGMVKGAISQFGTISQSALSSLPSIGTSTTTGMTSSNTASSIDGIDPSAVWDGQNFVSPTSPSGQQAIAQTTGATGGMANNTSNLSLEDQLKKEQLEILRQQRSESDALTKLVYQAAGIIKDPTTGEWRKATEQERTALMTDTERKEYSMYLQQLDRQQKALSGELPVSPALERELSDWDTQQKEELSRRLGSGYMTSTPGIQSMQRQQERTGLLREEARRGEIAAGSSRVMDWKNSLNNQGVQSLNAYSAIPGRTSGLLSGYANTLVPYTNQTSINAQNDRQASILAQDAYWKRQAQKDQQTQSKWSTIGTLGGYLFS